MKKYIFVLLSMILVNYMAAQGINKYGGIVTDASFTTINASGNITSNETISSRVGSFGKLILNTVSVPFANLNNYNVSDVGVLIVTGDGSNSFSIAGFSGGTIGQIMYLIDDRIDGVNPVQPFDCIDYTNTVVSANQRFFLGLNGNSKQILPNAIVTLVFNGTYWRILS